MKINLLCTDPKRGGRVSAGSIEDGVFMRKVSPTKHLIRKYRAFGIQREICDVLAADGIKEICFYTAGRTWTISMQMFCRFAFEEDLGHGPQMIIQLRHMTEKSKETQLSLRGVKEN